VNSPTLRIRRIVVTHTASYTFTQEHVDQVWKAMEPLIPSYLIRGNEESDPDARAMTVYEAFDDSLAELFNPRQDDDTGYEVEDYDPDA